MLMKTSGVLSSVLLLAALASGCGSSDSGAGGTGGTASGGIGSGGRPSGGTGGSGAVDPGGPLLDRPSGAKYKCSLSRAIARLSVPWSGFSLVSGAAGAELAVVAADPNNPDPNKSGNSIAWSTLGLDGRLGSTTAVRAPTRQYLASVAAASDGEKSTLVWGETSVDGGSHSLNSVQVNGSGAVVTDASVLTSLARAAGPKIARTGAGYALLWVDGTESSAKLTFGLLDDRGKLTSTPVVLAQGQYLAAGGIAPVEDHFVVSYADYQYRDSGLVSRLLVLGADGSALGEPVAFEDSSPTGFASTVPSLHTRGNQVLAAWSIVSGDSSFETQDAATTIRVARFDANGERQGPMYDLQAPVKDRENVQPFWLDVGDDLGLLWAEGDIIYICAGCVPNHLLRFVVLDGQTFTPQSNVVALANTLPSGGLLSPETVRVGDDLLLVSTVTYHTSGEGASATIRCAP
jgi:hypothetical protein